MNLHLAGGVWCTAFFQDRMSQKLFGRYFQDKAFDRNSVQPRWGRWGHTLASNLILKASSELEISCPPGKTQILSESYSSNKLPLDMIVITQEFACQQLYPIFKCCEEFFIDEVQYNIQKGSYNSGKTEYNPILRSSTTSIPMGFLNGWWVGQVANVAWESKGRVGSGKRPEGRVTTIWFWGWLPPRRKMKLKWVILYMVCI